MNVISVLVKTVGESLAALILTNGLSGMFGHSLPIGDFFKFPDGFTFGFGGGYGYGNATFLGGLIVLLTSVVIAVMLLTIAHFVAEGIVVFGDIASRLKNIETNTAGSSLPAGDIVPPPLP